MIRVGRPTSIPLLLAAAMLLHPNSVQATTVNVVGIPGWVAENPNNAGGGDVGLVSQVGWGGTQAPLGLAGLLFFELPLIALNETIVSADLDLLLSNARDSNGGIVPDGFNVDLYYVGERNTATLNKPGDYSDSTIPPPSGSVLVQDNWWIAGDNSQIGRTKSLSVLPQIQSAYTGNTPNDTFVVFALYGDADLSTRSVETYFFEDDEDNPGMRIVSQAVPEPSGLSCLLCGWLALRTGTRRSRKG